VLILDIRVPAVLLTELKGHGAPVNSFAWAPHSNAHICTAGTFYPLFIFLLGTRSNRMLNFIGLVGTGDDSHALVWDISQMTKQRAITDPILMYNAESEINQITWSSASSEWVGICYGDSIQALKV
jgi:DDB1- and CUL4-associated factor 7